MVPFVYSRLFFWFISFVRERLTLVGGGGVGVVLGG